MTPEKLFKRKTTTGTIIKAWREAFNISQVDMAYSCNISQSNLSSIEGDKIEIGTKIALRLAAFMGVHPSNLLFPNGFEKEPEFIETEVRVRKLKKIINN